MSKTDHGAVMAGCVCKKRQDLPCRLSYCVLVLCRKITTAKTSPCLARKGGGDSQMV